MFHLFCVAGSVTIGIVFVINNIVGNGFRDSWDCFLLAIILSIIIIDLNFCNFDGQKKTNRLKTKQIKVLEQISQNKSYSNRKPNKTKLRNHISQEVTGIISGKILDASTLDVFFSFRPASRSTENSSYKMNFAK